MKFSHNQFHESTFHFSESETAYVVKYKLSTKTAYPAIEMTGQYFEKVLKQACIQIAKVWSVNPENVDLRSLYDSKGQLLWADELPYILANCKSDEKGRSRREFLRFFGITNAALLLGLPKIARGATASVNLAGIASGFDYVDDVFRSYLYTGNGSNQMINNGIDLAGKGGLVWIKNRDNYSGVSPQHVLYDSVRGVGQTQLSTAITNFAGDSIYWGGNVDQLSSFNNNGFTVLYKSGTSTQVPLNGNTAKYASWTFRQANKFFQTFTVTKSSGSNATVDLSALGTVGMVAVKRIDASGSWYVWHTSLNAGQLLYLEQTAAASTLGHITVSGTTLTLVNGTIADGSYVVYAWAHDASADGKIQCGVFSAGVAGTIGNVTLGWEPQWLLFKNVGAVDDWNIVDTSIGFNLSSYSRLKPNTSSAEQIINGYEFYPTATGFSYKSGVSMGVNQTYIYIAIRRPNKPPSSGAQIYNSISYTSGAAPLNVIGVGFSPDLVLMKSRNNAGNPSASPVSDSTFWILGDRLRGGLKDLYTHSSIAEQSNDFNGMLQDGFSVARLYHGNSSSNVGYCFRRAPGFMDVVAYTGDGASTRNISHNLGAAPQMVLIKSRSSSSAWSMNLWSGTYYAHFNSSALTTATPNLTGFSNNAGWSPGTTTTFIAGEGVWAFNVNVSSATYIAYLFATLSGISKIGSYTGNGASQAINCGFTTSARFILIKRTDASGDWYVWDSVRSIEVANDPHLSLNTAAAEVTTDDSVDPDPSGFIVNQVAATNINVNGAIYVFFSIA